MHSKYYVPETERLILLLKIRKFVIKNEEFLQDIYLHEFLIRRQYIPGPVLPVFLGATGHGGLME